MSTPDERHQIANQASSYKINSFSDLPTDWHLRQPGPMFTATPPPLLSPSEISRYHTQYGKLVDGLNETSKDREILYKAWQRASQARRELWILWFLARDKRDEANQRTAGGVQAPANVNRTPNFQDSSARKAVYKNKYAPNRFSSGDWEEVSERNQRNTAELNLELSESNRRITAELHQQSDIQGQIGGDSEGGQRQDMPTVTQQESSGGLRIEEEFQELTAELRKQPNTQGQMGGESEGGGGQDVPEVTQQEDGDGLRIEEDIQSNQEMPRESSDGRGVEGEIQINQEMPQESGNGLTSEKKTQSNGNMAQEDLQETTRGVGESSTKDAHSPSEPSYYERVTSILRALKEARG